MGHGQQLDHLAASVTLGHGFEQPFEHEPVRLAREQLVAIGQLQQGHRLTPEAMDHVTVIQHIAMLGSAFRATAWPGNEITAAQEQIEPNIVESSEEQTYELQ